MNACECGHHPSSHADDTGACQHVAGSADGMYWFYDCHCPFYMWQGDQ